MTYVRWVIAGVLVYTLLALPFFTFHKGLPTGDSQKAIYWAREIMETYRLPNYEEAAARLNRAAGDFYTPGLHLLVALVMRLAPGWELTSVGLLAIALSLALIIVAVVMARTVWTGRYAGWVMGLTALFILTNMRFLRYVREPGYHLQNVLGELLLFSLLLVALKIVQRQRRRDVIIAIVLALALVASHQFSAFLAAFVLLPTIIYGLIVLFRQGGWPRVVSVVMAGGVIIVAVVVIRQLPSIFTLTPHLHSFIPRLTHYPALVGTLWMIGGLAGWAILFKQHQFVWVASSVILLVLTQGPRFGIDLPPVRTLFYSVVPLSIGAAVVTVHLTMLLKKRWLIALLIIVLLFPLTASVRAAYTLSHTVRTNSTLLPEQLALIDYLHQQSGDGAVLTDDYNRRSSSWLLLGGHPMFTRIAADLEVQMNEAEQSATRRQLYLNQLDFEKIFDLGSHPAIASLLDKHQIQWITGIEGSSAAAFARNPILRPVYTAGDITLFAYTGSTTSSDDITTWLLKPTTLVNDIGDDEDTFEHLPASVRSTRFFSGATTAPLIPLRFNVGDYVRVLWDPESIGRPSIATELYIITRQPVALSVITPSGTILPYTTGEVLRLNSSDLTIDGRGFIALMLDNPTQQRIELDLIALGLARVP